MIESLLGAITLMIAGYLIGSVRVIEEGDEGLVQRLGEYKRTLKPGLNFVVPLMDTVLVETTREQLLDIKPQKAVTKDSVPLEVDAVVYWKIKDLYSAYYKVEDLEDALKNIVISSMRNEVGQLDLNEVMSAMGRINTALKGELDKPAASWGIEIVRVDVQEIILSQTVRDSLEKQIAAKTEAQATLSKTNAAVQSISQLSEALSSSSNPQAVLQYLIAKDYVSANTEISKSENSKVIFMDPKALNEAISEMITPGGDR
ncbi:MAG: stomatin-like protein [Synechococcales bacterium]|nr:stomatin-like protein [Synechococcales bacterium]